MTENIQNCDCENFWVHLDESASSRACIEKNNISLCTVKVENLPKDLERDHWESQEPLKQEIVLWCKYQCSEHWFSPFISFDFGLAYVILFWGKQNHFPQIQFFYSTFFFLLPPVSQTLLHKLGLAPFLQFDDAPLCWNLQSNYSLLWQTGLFWREGGSYAQYKNVLQCKDIIIHAAGLRYANRSYALALVPHRPVLW